MLTVTPAFCFLMFDLPFISKNDTNFHSNACSVEENCILILCLFFFAIYISFWLLPQYLVKYLVA